MFWWVGKCSRGRSLSQLHERDLWSPTRLTAAKVAESGYYCGFVAAVIVLSMSHSVYETDLRAAGEMPVLMAALARCFTVFYVLDVAFLVYIYRHR